MATKNVLNLSASDAKQFFLREENYSNILLPTYFGFQNLLDKLDKKLQFDIVQKIITKLEEKPNTEYMEIWLQRIMYKDAFPHEYNSNICKLVMDKTLPPIWNIDWVDNDIKNIINNTPIIDYQKLSNLGAEIKDDEIDIFYYDG